jgi:hypothetical protein
MISPRANLLGALVVMRALGALAGPFYLFDRPICTGLGDRMGTMLSLAALARLENATVAFLWCHDPAPILPRQRKYMPGWVGFNYSLAEFKQRFRPPPELVFVSSLTLPELKHLPRVQWGTEFMPLPAEAGGDAIPNIAWLTMRLGKNAHIDAYQLAYRSVASEMMANVDRQHDGLEGEYIVLHMRGPDKNTYYPDHSNIEYCTGKLVKRMLKRGPAEFPIIYAISNNVSWAEDLLEGRVEVLDESYSAYDHFSLLMGAVGIVQHAWGGWSSYSSIAALLSGAPMINTFDTHMPSHRFAQFHRITGLPVNYYDCSQRPQFISALTARLKPPETLPASVDHNSATLLYTLEGHQHLVSPSLNDDSRLAPLTRWVQSYIHGRQFLPDCSKGRFMVTDGWKAGFGAEMHTIGVLLGYAIEHNFTLLLSPHSCRAFADPSVCQKGCECILAPISNCKYSEARHSQRIHNEGHQMRFFVPTVFRQAILLRYPRMTDRQVWYWWRGQSAAFVTRFNEDTVQKVASLRHKQGGLAYLSNGKPLPFPLSSGTINAFIRGGDKYEEMRLVGPEKYISAALDLVATNPNAYSEHTLFLSGDDSNSIDEGVRMGEAGGLSVAYSKVHREKGGHFQNVWMQKVGAGGRMNFVYDHLLQLTMALEADAWIGTRFSNWGRMIDGLRCVWVDKCKHSYVEVGDEPLGTYGW